MSAGAGTVIVAIFGLVVGSFLNVCIHRLPRHESIIKPRSRCPSCGTTIRWFDNVPVVGYFMLRGRCRSCGARIAARYPLVEIATAAAFVAVFVAVGPGALLIPRLAFVASMIALLIIDLEHRLLPNAITVPGIVAGVLFSLVAPPGWRSSLVGLAIGGGVLLATSEVYYRLRDEEGLGMGDVKMLAMIGAFLGWQLMLLTLIIGSMIGSLIGLGLILRDRRNLKFALPFGTFLALGAILASVAGDRILAWYLSFY